VKPNKGIFVVLLAFILAPVHPGIVYRVDGTRGSDSNPGTPTLPWRTIQKAADTMVAGDSVIVAAGNYPERITVSRSGARDILINYTADGLVECQGFTIKSDYIRIAGFKVTSNTATPYEAMSGIRVEGKYCLIEDNFAYYNPSGGIILSPSSSHCIIKKNKCERNGLSGMIINGTNNLIEQNEVWASISYHTPTGTDNGDADGMRFHGSGHIFRDNDIHDIRNDDPENTGRWPHIDGFQTFHTSIDAASNILFERNRIDLTKQPNGSGFTCEDASYITIRNNIIIAPRGMDTYGSNNHRFDIFNNTIIGDLAYNQDFNPHGIALNETPYSSIKNNIFFEQPWKAIDLLGTTSGDTDIGNNCLYNSDGSIPGGAHSPRDLWLVDPRFVNPARGDYHLLAESRCIDAGVTLPDVTDDFDSSPRPMGSAYDIGAYEYATSDFVAPSILVQPQSLTIQIGQAASLNVLATGTAPLSYQWYQGLSGNTSNFLFKATASALTLPALTESTNYWVRISNRCRNVDSQMAMITVISPPKVTTTAVSSVTRVSAKSGGVVTSDGGSAIIERGVCWGTSPKPTISDSKITSGSGMGSYVCQITGLTLNKTYYLRAYATSSAGTGYGQNVIFRTSYVNTAPFKSMNFALLAKPTSLILSEIFFSGMVDSFY